MDFCFEGVISLVCLLLGWMHGLFFGNESKIIER